MASSDSAAADAARAERITWVEAQNNAQQAEAEAATRAARQAAMDEARKHRQSSK